MITEKEFRHVLDGMWAQFVQYRRVLGALSDVLQCAGLEMTPAQCATHAICDPRAAFAQTIIKVFTKDPNSYEGFQEDIEDFLEETLREYPGTTAFPPQAYRRLKDIASEDHRVPEPWERIDDPDAIEEA